MLSNRAVSPVIGVILMVAITVILAAVIGGFVMDLGEHASGSDQPRVSFDYMNNSDGTLTLRHTAGETLDADNVVIKAGRADASSQFADSLSTVSAGDSITVNVTSGERVSVIYTKGDQSTILSEHEVA